MEVRIRALRPGDWNEVAEIYRQGISTGNATFETMVPEWDKWDSVHLKECRLVATVNDSVVAWAALLPVSQRKVYSGVAEVSIYVSEVFKGIGIGRKLMRELIAESEREGFWTLQSVIFPENEASFKLHKEFGFREVGFREKIGKMNGLWRNTLLFERRSRNTGL
jgi:L-amino acid N-acyltransferase YncA